MQATRSIRVVRTLGSAVHAGGIRMHPRQHQASAKHSKARTHARTHARAHTHACTQGTCAEGIHADSRACKCKASAGAGAGAGAGASAPNVQPPGRLFVCAVPRRKVLPAAPLSPNCPPPPAPHYCTHTSISWGKIPNILGSETTIRTCGWGAAGMPSIAGHKRCLHRR